MPKVERTALRDNTGNRYTVFHLFDHKHSILDSIFLDRILVATASKDKTVNLFNQVTGERMYQIKSDNVPLCLFKDAENSFACSFSDSTVKIFDFKGNQTSALSHGQGQINKMTSTKEGLLLGASSEGSVVLLDVRGNKLCQSFSSKENQISLGLKLIDEHILAHSSGSTVRLLDLRNLDKQIQSFRTETEITCIDSLKSGELLVSSIDGNLRKFHFDGKLISTFNPHNHSVTSFLPVFPRQNLFLTSSADSKLKLIKFGEENKVLHTFHSHSLPVYGVKINSEFGGNKLLSFGTENACKVWKFTQHLKDTSLHEILLENL